MNIKEAKNEIKNAMKAYFTKDEFGGYVIPLERQRPIFMMGPPGIGKTAIMEQIASELNVGLVSYSMTHHTRQSALGLPFIVTKKYGGREYSVSEYTMSEIIATVYELMERTGMKEGILFLDEINCVSETLAPSMLQFLQYKIFGRHRVPEGWIVVTAGNPPEYNDSVRDFDIATWDRLKRVDVEPDYGVWKEYACKRGVHAAILSYLDIKKQNFFRIETTVDGKSFVTARGWCDLSDMMELYERNGIAVGESLVVQYLQNKKIARDFAVYYDLFNKYRSDYQVDRILSGEAPEAVRDRAAAAAFDERLALLSLMLERMTKSLRRVYLEEIGNREFVSAMKGLGAELGRPGAGAAAAAQKQAESLRKRVEDGRLSLSLSADDDYALRGVIRALEGLRAEFAGAEDADREKALAMLKNAMDKRAGELKALVKSSGGMLSNAFRFAEEAFGDGQEMLILVTELTVNFYASRFISRYGCREYFAHNRELLLYKRRTDLIQELEGLDLESK